MTIYVIDPSDPGNYPVCPFLDLTGYHCPGCGTLRALNQLLHGNVLAALGYNVLAAASLPFIAYSFIREVIREMGMSVPRPTYLDHRLIWALFVGVIAFWILRNIAIESLTILAP